MLRPPAHARVTGFLVLLGIVLLDQWSKTAVLQAAQAASIPREVLGILNLVLVKNRGISFGMFSHPLPWMPLALTLVTSAITLGLAFWLIRTHDRITPLALGCIIGGAVGNIADRLRLGAVTDFLDFHVQQYHWPAFNLADSAIFIGVVILALIGIVGPAKEDACGS